jgi:hypothetical protein
LASSKQAEQHSLATRDVKMLRRDAKTRSEARNTPRLSLPSTKTKVDDDEVISS